MTNHIEQIRQLNKTVNDLWVLIQSVRTPRFHAKLNLQEKIIICYLGENKDKTMKELAEYFGIGFSTMTGVIGRLEEKGIIIRKPSELDRRSVIVNLEEKWQHTFEIYLEEQEKIAQTILKAITKKKFDLIMKLLSEATHNINKSKDKVRRLV